MTFDQVLFERQKTRLIESLGEDIKFYVQEGLSDSEELMEGHKQILAEVEKATTSEQLIDIVEKDPTLLNFLSK